MSSLPEAVPLALAASFAPAAILVLIVLLTAEHPRRLVFAYLAGAAVTVGTLGVGALFLLTASGATQQDSRSTSASVDLVLGIALVALAVWAWRRRQRVSGDDGDGARQGRVAAMSHRATASVRWAFALGLLMYIASPLYIAAIKSIADSGDSTASQMLAVLICGLCVLLFVEIPAFVLLVRPDGLKATLERFTTWLSANSWALLAVLAGAAGAWMLGNAITGLG